MSLIKKIINFFRNLFKKKPAQKAKPIEAGPPKSEKVLAGKPPIKTKTGETYRILKEPHISEKATKLSDERKYTFKVFFQANKNQIKKAISNLYGVRVKHVKIINIKPKKRTLRGIEGTKIGYKKAIVTLEQGEKIEIMPH